MECGTVFLMECVECVACGMCLLGVYGMWDCIPDGMCGMCLLGVYGMWNIYVFCLLIFYAPSTKYMAVADTGMTYTFYIFMLYIFMLYVCLRCFYTVGCMSGRASGP